MTMEMITLCIIALCFIILFIIGRTSTDDSNCTFRFNRGFMLREECQFLNVLEQALPEHYRVFAKVHMTDVLRPHRQLNQGPRTTFKQFATKRFDYIICDKESMDVVAAVELDGKCHRRPKIKRRDRQITDACATAGLKLVRFDVRPQYDLAEVRAKVLYGLQQPLESKSTDRLVAQAI